MLKVFLKASEWIIDKNESSVGTHAIVVMVRHIDTDETHTISFKRIYDKNKKPMCWDTGSCTCEMGIYGINRLCKHKIKAMGFLEDFV